MRRLGTCSVKECRNPARARDLCARHYNYAKLRGLPIPPRLGHGHTNGRKTSPEYKSWGGMIQRCENPKNPSYHNYGGRGVRVCRRWHDFVCFLKDMGPKPSPLHTLERVDNDRGYSARNCRWATRPEQARNTGRNRWLIVDGVRITAKDASREYGIHYQTLRNRLKRGLPDAIAVKTPRQSPGAVVIRKGAFVARAVV